MPNYREPEPINIGRELARYYNSRYNRIGAYHREADNANGLQSQQYDPMLLVENKYGALRTVDRYQNRTIPCETLRRVSTKCWIIQACILNVQKKIKPFLKPVTDRNTRGYVVLKKGDDLFKATGTKSKKRDEIEQFLKTTGVIDDPDREDTFIKYSTKIIRDMLEIDQIATEIQYDRGRKPIAFWGVDAATIEKIVPGQDNPEDIRYVQVINHIPCAFYTKDELILDFQNPRTDIRYSFYGYSYVEQAIDLVTSVINAFTYNAGFFTENRLPRGMLLIDGDASQETVAAMEGFLEEALSGSPARQWKIPIIPSGIKKGEAGNKIQFVELHGKNREMEFMQWLDYLNSGVASIFSTTLEDLGIHSQKSQPVWDSNKEPVIKLTKGLILGDTLSFYQDYVNQIIEKFYPDYQLEFVGYEKDDPKEVVDIDKAEIESYKTLNEKREEKGLKALDYEWANIPQSPQSVQLFSNSQMGGGMEDMGDMGMDGMGEMPGYDEGDDNENDGAGADGNEGEDSQDFDGSGGDFGSGKAPESTEKSLRDNTIRIVI
jgi:hypothetical protein